MISIIINLHLNLNLPIQTKVPYANSLDPEETPSNSYKSRRLIQIQAV